MAEPSLEVSVAERGVLVRVNGELDYESGPRLWEQLTQVLTDDVAFIVLDLAGVSFCDSAGLNLLLRTRRQATSSGTELGLACVPHGLRHILAMTGTDQVLHVYDTVTDAETDLRNRDHAAEHRT